MGTSRLRGGAGPLPALYQLLRPAGVRAIGMQWRSGLNWRAPSLWRGGTIGLYGGSFNPPHAGHAYVARWAMKAARLSQLWWMVSPQNPLKRHGEQKASQDQTSRPASKAVSSPWQARLQACRAFIRHPRLKIMAPEAALAAGGMWEGAYGKSCEDECGGEKAMGNFTLRTVLTLKQRMPATNWVLIIGADNWRDFHYWRGWRQLIAQIPILVVGRDYRAGLPLSQPIAGRGLRAAPLPQANFTRSTAPQTMGAGASSQRPGHHRAQAARQYAKAQHRHLPARLGQKAPPAWAYLAVRLHPAASRNLRYSP
jgi:nicotinate-nucleotide adenylyltransferase